jgi:N-methylhydantoinase B
MPDYFRPRSLSEALALRAERPLVVLAGGTDVFPAKTARAGWGDMRHGDVLDISALAELRGIAETATHFRFGALTTWTELRRADLPAAFAGWQAAAREIGGMQVQNRGTPVGNICTASPAGDGIPCLLTLDAEVELASAAERRVMPIAEFIDGYRHTVLRSDELVTALLMPKPRAGARGGFVKLGARRYLVISIVMAAGVMATDDSGMVTDAAVAVGACSPVARRLPTLEAALIGRDAAAAASIAGPEHLAELMPLDDVRGSAAYRRAAALEAVRDLLDRFGGGQARRAA